MKTKLSIGIMLLGLALCSTAQITINRSDIGNLVGATVILANDSTDLDLLSPGLAGAERTWNLTGIGSDYTDSTLYSSPEETPCFENFPTATLVTFDADSYTYLYDDNNVMEELGICDPSISPDPFSIPYTPSIKILTFPSTYHTTYSGQTKIRMQSAFMPPMDSIRIDMYGYYTSIIDGWGTVITPAGSYSALRQKNITYITDSSYIYIDGYGWMFNDVSYDSVIGYKWLSQNNPFIAEIITNFSGNVTSANYLLNPTLGLNDTPNNQTSFTVYPNPAKNKITITGNGNLQSEMIVSIYNIQGEQVLPNIYYDQNAVEIDISSLVKGIYIVTLKGNQYIETKKLVVQ
jgi:hypothetical protein